MYADIQHCPDDYDDVLCFGCDYYSACEEGDPDRVLMHPNQIDNIGCESPEDALIGLIDLKHGYLGAE